MFHIRVFLAAFSMAFNLLTICNAESIPGELVVSQPTLAATCQCRPGEACQCGDDCTCHKDLGTDLNLAHRLNESKSVLVRKPRIDATSPITLAPDPDYPIQLAADRRVISAPLQRFRRVMTGYTCANGQCTPQYRYEAIPATPAPAPAAAPPQTTTTAQRQRVTVRANARFAPVRRLFGR